jgi:hypothetical protein
LNLSIQWLKNNTWTGIHLQTDENKQEKWSMPWTSEKETQPEETNENRMERQHKKPAEENWAQKPRPGARHLRKN